MAPILCPRFVGRAGPLAEVSAAVAGADGAVVLVLGEAGTGKSRLLRTVAAAPDGPVVLRGRAVPGAGGPYRALAEAVLGGLRAHGEPTDPDLRPYRPVLAPLIPAWGPGPRTSGAVLGEGLIRLAAALGGARGTVLVLEDLHWADPDTLDVLHYVVGSVVDRPVACVASARGGPVVARLAGAVLEHGGSVVELEPLRPREVEEMARACLGVDDVPPTLPDLLDRADGVPLLVEELLATAVQTGALHRDGAGGWRYRPDPVAPVPRTVADTVAERMRRIGVDDREVLRAAAVLGRRFDWTVLGPALDRSPPEVLAALRAAADAQLLVLDGGGFRFRHALTRDAVLDQLVPLERAAVARALLEAGGPGTDDGATATLHELAGDRAAAASLLARSARRALGVGAAGSARVQGERARLLAAGDRAVRSEVDEVLLDVAAQTGDTDRASALAAELDALAPPLAPSRRCAAHLRAARAALTAGRVERAAEHAERAAGIGGGAAEVTAVRAEVALARGRTSEAEHLARTVLDNGPTDPTTRCAALEVLGRAVRQHDIAAAARVFARQVAAAPDPHWRLRALHQLGTVDLLATLRTEQLDEARRTALTIGALAIAAVIDMQVAGNLASGFRVDESLARARRSVRVARRLGLGILPHALVVEAGAHAVAGDGNAVRNLLEEALRGDVDPDLRSAAIGRCTGIAALLTEDRAGAVAAFDEAMALVEDLPGATARPYFGLWALLRCVHGDRGAEACAAARERSAGINGIDALVDLGDAVLLGRAGHPTAAARTVALAEERLAVYEDRFAGIHQMARRLLAEAALQDGWGDPAAWALEASEFFRASGHRVVEDACRALVARAGGRLPRRHHGRSRVPAELRRSGVTDREVDVLVLLGEGLTDRQVAARLVISPRTVEKHVERLRAKTGAPDRSALRSLGTRLGAVGT